MYYMLEYTFPYNTYYRSLSKNENKNQIKVNYMQMVIT